MKSQFASDILNSSKHHLDALYFAVVLTLGVVDAR